MQPKRYHRYVSVSCETSRVARSMPRTKAETLSRKARILVVDDHPIVRQGLSLLIDRQPDLIVCGEADDMPAALKAIEALKPDIVILDISLEGPDGMEVLKNIRIDRTKLPVLVLSMHDESLYAERALRAGANGYIMKQEATEKVLEARAPPASRRSLCQRTDRQENLAAVRGRFAARKTISYR